MSGQAREALKRNFKLDFDASVEAFKSRLSSKFTRTVYERRCLHSIHEMSVRAKRTNLFVDEQVTDCSVPRKDVWKYFLRYLLLEPQKTYANGF